MNVEQIEVGDVEGLCHAENARILVAGSACWLGDVSRRFCHAGYHVAEVKTGVECLLHASEFRPDLILLEGGVGDIAPIAVCRLLRANRTTARAKIILCPDDCTMDEALREADDSVVDAVLIQPVDEDELIEMAGSLARRKIEREALELDDAGYRETLEQIPAAVYTSGLDPLCTAQLAGPQIEASLGYSQADWRCNPHLWSERIHPDDRKRVLAERAACRAAGRRFVSEYRLLSKEGRAVWFHDEASPVRDPGGKTVGYHGVMVDITQRKEAEEALRDSEALYHSLVQNIPAAVFRKNLDGRFSFANNAMCRLLERPIEEILDKTDFDLLPPGLAQKSRNEDLQVIDSRHSLESVGELGPKKDGEKTHVRTVKTPLFGPSGEVVGTQGIIFEITDRVNLEAQLRQAQKLEALGQLAGGVAHDFNNMLTVILADCSLMAADPCLCPDSVVLLKEMKHAAERAVNLTRQLLAFSRKQVGQAQRLDLNDVLGGMSRMLQRIIGEDIALVHNFAPSPRGITADPGMIEHVLMNLAVNARGAMPIGGQLTITTSQVEITDSSAKEHPSRRPGQFVQLTVADTGCGIPAEVLPHIFEPFFTTKEAGRGTGLGLATVRSVIAQHFGWVEVESQVGRGTTFAIYLPISPDGENARPEATRATSQRGGCETILVVEDESSLLNLMSKVLSRLGYRIHCATSGEDALRVWQDFRDQIDLVITDMVLAPGMTGRELTDRLRAEKPGLRVLHVSGYSPELAGRDWIQAPGRQFLPKPFFPERLAQTVRQCLDSV